MRASEEVDFSYLAIAYNAFCLTRVRRNKINLLARRRAHVYNYAGTHVQSHRMPALVVVHDASASGAIPSLEPLQHPRAGFKSAITVRAVPPLKHARTQS